jgi:hypothetical protein
LVLAGTGYQGGAGGAGVVTYYSYSLFLCGGGGGSGGPAGPGANGGSGELWGGSESAGFPGGGGRGAGGGFYMGGAGVGEYHYFYGDAGANGEIIITYAPQSVIPEPSTLVIWSLFGGLAVTVGWYRRWKPA